MRIRQPLEQPWPVILGCVSIAILVGSYELLARSRQAAKRQAAQDELASVEEQLLAWQDDWNELAEAEREGEGATGQRLTRQKAQLESSRERFARDAESAEDRSVPTLGALYRDGLLRALRSETLGRAEHWLWEDGWASLRRLAAGLAVGVFLSVLVGLAMGCYAPIAAFLLSPLSLLAKIPPTAMLAVFFVLVGTGFEMYITMIAFGTLPTLAQSVYAAALKDVPDELIDKAKTLGASSAELVFMVIFRQILPRLIDAIRLQVGPAMVLLVAAEWMVGGEGFGYRLRLFFQRTDMTVVFVYLLVLGLFGLAVDVALTRLRRWWCPWFGE